MNELLNPLRWGRLPWHGYAFLLSVVASVGVRVTVGPSDCEKGESLVRDQQYADAKLMADLDAKLRDYDLSVSR